MLLADTHLTIHVLEIEKENYERYFGWLSYQAYNIYKICYQNFFWVAYHKNLGKEGKCYVVEEGQVHQRNLHYPSIHEVQLLVYRHLAPRFSLYQIQNLFQFTTAFNNNSPAKCPKAVFNLNSLLNWRPILFQCKMIFDTIVNLCTIEEKKASIYLATNIYKKIGLWTPSPV